MDWHIPEFRQVRVQVQVLGYVELEHWHWQDACSAQGSRTWRFINAVCRNRVPAKRIISNTPSKESTPSSRHCHSLEASTVQNNLVILIPTSSKAHSCVAHLTEDKLVLFKYMQFRLRHQLHLQAQWEAHEPLMARKQGQNLRSRAYAPLLRRH